MKQQQEEELRIVLTDCSNALAESIRLLGESQKVELPESISRGLKRSMDYLEAERKSAVIAPARMDEGSLY